MTQNLKSPEYLALQNKYDAVCEAITNSGAVVTVAHKLKASKLISGNAKRTALAGVVAGRDPTLVVGQMMQPVSTRISFSTQSFYHLCDALDIPDIMVPISEILRKECGACVCVRACKCVCVVLCACVHK